MEFQILGSGGCVSLPKPLCRCRVCTEARKKGVPYSRFGCSLYFKDLNLIVDTPEDIAHSLNYANIEKVDTVLYSHMDPDHTLGMRVFEQLRLNWLEVSKGIECKDPIRVLAMQHVIDDLNQIKSKYGPYMDYYENVRNLIVMKSVDEFIELKGVKISFIKVSLATIFIFESENKKLIYAPCDVKPFPNNEKFYNADYLIIGNTIIGDTLKDGFKLEENNLLKQELFVMEEIVSIRKKYNISKVIMTHLEEDWGKSYDDYLKLEKQYDNIQFAYDGMCITL